MRFVLDNSVSMRWFFRDGKASDLVYSDNVLAEIKKWGSLVPVTWGLEVANVLARAESKGQVTAVQSGLFIKMLIEMEIDLDADTFEHSLSDTLQLARTYKLSAYDASYLELALRLDVPLATLDEGLRKAAKKAGVKILTS